MGAVGVERGKRDRRRGGRKRKKYILGSYYFLDSFKSRHQQHACGVSEE